MPTTMPTRKSTLLFYNGRIATRSGVIAQGWLRTLGGVIAELGPGSPPRDRAGDVYDLQGATLAPGFIDIHVHGALGIDTMDADVQGLGRMARFFARHGVTAFLATTMSAPDDAVSQALEAVAEAQQTKLGGAKLLGAHLEGPYLDTVRRGAHVLDQVRTPMPDEYRHWLDSGVVKLITLAPELPGAQRLICEARERRVAIAAGHTRATLEQMLQAVRLGVSQITHLFNAMEPMHHRRPGAVCAALLCDALRCQLIADLVHVHPAMLKLAYRLKGPSGIILITDAMRGTGMPDGEYELGNMLITVQEGIARTPEGALAGSTLTMDRALRNMLQVTGHTLETVLPMATANPAAAIGIARRKGEIAVGMDADLVVLDQRGQVRLTVVEGHPVYRAHDKDERE